MIPGDQARSSVQVGVPQAEAFRIFTEEIDQWWRRGRKYRVAGKHRGVIHIEPKLGGRLFEEFDTGRRSHVIETGRITAWEPPARVVFEWRIANFAPGEKTEVEVEFEPRGEGTYVTVTHRGWSKIRPDHPARHGKDVPAFIRMNGMWWADLLTALREHAGRAGP